MYREIRHEKRKRGSFSENVTTMTLKSVKEDLQARTLRAVHGVLGKLEYVAGLRQENGSYMHWGLSRVHGEDAAQKALVEAHKGLISTILRMPLGKLLDDLSDSCGTKHQAEIEFLSGLECRESQIVPANPGPGLRRHLNSVLHALSELTKHRP